MNFVKKKSIGKVWEMENLKSAQSLGRHIRFSTSIVIFIIVFLGKTKHLNTSIAF